ncbi:MAG: hypothetical protein COB90_09335 [Hyphomicrobiales bacterium]|nr:MAG: hypothetical protein COB90_09335 [Hyphomicrobiales bacterium]
MSRYEKMSWAGLAIIFAIWCFASWKLTGVMTPGDMAWLLCGMLVAVATGLGAAHIYFWSKAADSQSDLDEREQFIEDRAEKYSYRVLDGFISLLIAAAVWEAAYGPWFNGSFSLYTPTGLVLALVSVLGFSGLVRFVTGIVSSRLS